MSLPNAIRSWPIDHVTVNNKEIPVRLGKLRYTDLCFFPENPRLYTIVNTAGGLSQEEIEEELWAMDHVKQLAQSIKSNGGITDPLLVAYMDTEWIVIEGNSRLAALRTLAKKEPKKWDEIKCRVLPEEVTEDEIFSILGEYHIIGRKDWSPYEQAGYLYRRHKKQKISVDKISSELGLSKRELNHLLSVYEFMIEKGENNPSRWSYYDAYFRCRKVMQVRPDYPNLDNVIIKKIRKKEIKTAQDLRDKLPPILSSNKKTIQNFLSSKSDFYESYDRSSIQGSENAVYKRLRKFRTWCADTSEMITIISSMPDNQKDKCTYELKKIYQITNQLFRRLNRSVIH